MGKRMGADSKILGGQVQCEVVCGVGPLRGPGRNPSFRVAFGGVQRAHREPKKQKNAKVLRGR